MKVIAISAYYAETGVLMEQLQVTAEFDAEAEFQGSQGDAKTGMITRSSEIGLVAAELLDALRTTMEDME